MRIKVLFLIFGLAILGEVIWAVFYLTNPLKFFEGKLIPSPFLATAEEEGAVLFLDPPFGEFKKGSSVATSVILDSKKNLVTGADVVLRFDPKYLEVVDTNPKVAGTQVAPGPIFSEYLGNIVDPIRGKITISGLTKVDQSFSGRGIFAKIEFLSKKAGKTKVFFEFQPGATNDSNITSTSTKDILTRTGSGEYVIKE